MARKKKQQIFIDNVTITGIADKGKSVGRDETGRVIFVDQAAPEDVVNVRVVKKKKGYIEGVVVEYKQLSSHRTIPFCKHYDSCGGCQWQHLAYAEQLRHKEIVVHDAATRIGKLSPEVLLPIVGADETQFYRNKLEFAFSNKMWLTKDQLNDERFSPLNNVVGFHPKGAFDKVIDIEACWLQPEPSNEIRNKIREWANEMELPFYDARAQDGYLRNMMLRVTTQGQILLILAVKKDKPSWLLPLLDKIVAHFPQITSLYYCINPKMNDYMMDLDMVLYHGYPTVEEHLGDVRFHIGPKSFFQTNTHQGKKLYDVVVEFAELKGTENVYDLYTGLGSIALYVAKHAKSVVGIEEIPEAIEDAKANARLNEIDNCTFYAGDVKDILTEEFAEKHGTPDLVITDPPRAGMHPKVVEMLLQLNAPKMVYVSCNPSTQARDLLLLSEQYDVVKLQPVDMFPHTYHIETVALLVRKG